MRPGLARVVRAVDAVADREIGPVQPFAACRVDDVVVGRRDRDGADRLRVFMVEDRLPGAAGIGGLPHAAVYLAYVEDVGLVSHAGSGPRAPTTKGPDHAPVQVRQGTAVRSGTRGRQAEARKHDEGNGERQDGKRAWLVGHSFGSSP